MGNMKNIQASLKSQVEHGIVNIAGYGVPTDSVTGKDVCGPGSIYYDATGAVAYQNWNTAADPQWATLGANSLGTNTVNYAALSQYLNGRYGATETHKAAIMKVSQVVFDPGNDAAQRPIGAYVLGTNLFGTYGFIIGGFALVEQTFTSATDAATIAIHIQSANDIISAIAISNGANPWDAGKKAIIPKMNTPETTAIELTAVRSITATVAVEALTAGRVKIFIFHVAGQY